MTDLERKQSQLIYNLRYEKEALKNENNMLKRELEDLTKPIPAEEWHEDDGNVIWWKCPINEPPYVGTPLDSDFEEDYYTHFTRLIEPLDIDE